jgi:NitT/TauT family transport system substrate-binding protein
MININSLRVPLLFLFIALSTWSCNNATGRDTGGPGSGVEVNIGRVICGGHLPLAIVEKKFQDVLSFKLNAVQYHDWNVVVKDMLAGRLSGTFILSPLAMDLIKNGFPGKIVMLADRNGNGFILSEKIASIADLKGRKSIIAVPHVYSQHHVLLHLALRQNLVPAENVSVVGMPPRDMINALRRNEIDGFVVGEPEAAKSISLGVGHMAALSTDVWKDHMDHVLLLTDGFIKDEPQKAGELVAALLKAGRFIEANPGEAALMGEDYTGSNAKIFEGVLTTPPDRINYGDMRPTAADIEAFSGLLVEMGLWKEKPPSSSMFIDTRLLDAAR